MHTEQSLQLLGFSEKEAKVYVALNTIGAAASSTIARITHINRTTMYDVLESLLKQNYIIRFQQGKDTFYVVDDVSKLIHTKKQQLGLATQLVDDLTSMQKGEGIGLHYYVGKEGVREMYEEQLREEPKEILVWVHLDTFLHVFEPEYEMQWTKRRVKKGITVRLLMQDTPEARDFQKKDKTNLRKTILLPEKFMFESACFLYNQKICFFDTKHEIRGIRISNPLVASMQRQMFEMNWEMFS